MVFTVIVGAACWAVGVLGPHPAFVTRWWGWVRSKFSGSSSASVDSDIYAPYVPPKKKETSKEYWGE